jgi:hypothetical protein
LLLNLADFILTQNQQPSSSNHLMDEKNNWIKIYENTEGFNDLVIFDNQIT